MLSRKRNRLIKIGGAGAGRIFTESYAVKVERNLPTDTYPVL
jgi:hypothetical protein